MKGRESATFSFSIQSHGGQHERRTWLQAPSFPESIKWGQQQDSYRNSTLSPCDWVGRILLHKAAPQLCRAGRGAAQLHSPCRRAGASMVPRHCPCPRTRSQVICRHQPGHGMCLDVAVMWIVELIYGDVSSVVIVCLRAGGCLWPLLGISRFVLWR